MNTTILHNWTHLPKTGGVQIAKFSDPERAFEYAKKEYLPFGYTEAYFCTDVQTLFLFVA